MAIIAGELDNAPGAILNILLINKNLFNHEFDSN
jgi:hypothetical protein